METSSRQRAQQRPGQSLRARVTSSFLSNASIARADDSMASRTPPRAMGSWKTAGPAVNPQQASSSVMAGRKLFNRSTNPSRTGVNTTRSFSDIPTTTPGKVFASSSFRSGLQNGSNAKFSFSPRVPHNTARESFPAVTPGRSFRGSSVDINGRAMSKASASALFQMRIASPPPELDGEELTKRVPQSSDRVGSVYADEFLSHLVPPELDDLQRRQFLCILDLRRLKYAATEIFAKKDWRVNIMNFAKEYEKSRSLIMLRYGLYEFKTVPASRELLKKWKQENNVPDEVEEMADDSTPKSNGTSNNFRSSIKRRAEEELTKDEVPTSFAASPNKRRAPNREPHGEFSNAGSTPMPKKSKRGPDAMDESDETQPTKFKQSATRSIFEEIANNSPARRAASPPKPAAKPLPAATTSQSSLFSQPSSQSALTKTSAFGSNIFGHLSEQNTPKGSDDEESEAGESENDVEEEEAPAKKSKAPSAAPTFGNATSSLFGAKPSGASGSLFAAPSQGTSLFDRMSKGADGEPLKVADVEMDKPSEERPASPQKQSAPQDKTWNPNTPIKFGSAQPQTSTPLFGASTTQPSSLFSKPTDTPTFGIQAKDFATETPKPAAKSLFGQSTKPSETGTSLFGNANQPFTFEKSEEKAQDTAATPSTPSLFGAQASTTPFGKPAEASAPQGQSKSLFGGLNTPSAPSSGPSLFSTAAEKPSGSLFGATNGDKPAAPAHLFSVKSSAEDKKEESSAKRKKSNDGDSEKPVKTFSFGGPAPTPAQHIPPKTAAAANGATDAASVFGAADSGKKTFSFGAAAPAPAATPAAAPTPAPAASTSLFGNATASQAEAAKPQPSLFASSTTPSTGFAFGASSSAPSNNRPPTMFGASTNATTSFDANKTSGFSFGGSTEPAAGNSFTFNAGGGDSFNNPFAKNSASSQPPSFQFGATSQTPAPAASTPFQFGGSSQAAPSTGFSFGAGSQPANDAPAPMFGGGATNGGSSMFTFGGSQQTTQPAAPSMFGGQPANAAQGIFASQLAVPPAGSSTGASK